MVSTADAARDIPEKSLFRIGEVSRLTATKTFVLRFWESEFPMLQPVKSPSGHRLYRREDIETVLEIKRLLYDQGFTIAGARKHLAEQGGSDGVREGQARAPLPTPDPPPRQEPALRKEPARHKDRRFLLDLREELRAILTLLERG
jgi:DNA-binding transcriptional MerR regulator